MEYFTSFHFQSFSIFRASKSGIFQQECPIHFLWIFIYIGSFVSLFSRTRVGSLPIILFDHYNRDKLTISLPKCFNSCLFLGSYIYIFLIKSFVSNISIFWNSISLFIDIISGLFLISNKHNDSTLYDMLLMTILFHLGFIFNCKS